MSRISSTRLLRVHARGGLVEQQQLRLGGQRPRNLEPPLAAIRKTGRWLIGELFQIEDLEQLHRALARVRLFFVVLAGSEHGVRQQLLRSQMVRRHDVLQNRHVCKQPDVLKGPRGAEPGDLVRLLFFDAQAVELDFTFCRAIDACQHVEHRRLAGSVGSNQTVQREARHRHLQRLHGGQPAESHRHVVGH